MSAVAVESSPKRTVNTARIVPSTVPPQAVSDRTLLDSVTGFINEVTLTNLPQIDPKDQILWARFENTSDISDPTFGEDWDLEGGIPPPLILLLGYGTGVQCWAIPANGEAIEVLSWRHGCVRALRILPLPVSSGGGYVTSNDDGDYAQDAASKCGGGGGLSATRDEDDNQHDQYAPFRPLMAICDAGATGSGPQYCSVNFISLRSGEQVKSIKFKNPVLDILANRSAIVVTFAERIAVFDAKTLEDRLTITTCYPGTNLNPNPVTLGPRWLAYAERKMLPSKRSSGGCDCDGVASYTATVLNAAKSLGKGLRELGEQMAAGFSSGGAASAFGISVGGLGGHGGSSGNGPDDTQPGVITILDIKYSIKDASPTTGAPISSTGSDPIVAHFIAHSDAIVALDFDCSGILLATADKRGHDFHVFRIQPHPGGPSMAAVHHLYVLHRGDTTSKVQNITYSLDSRWIAVSTLRGTTHVFPVTPYGGPAGVRTHGSPHVVNRLSRFHRSAGLSVDGRSNSPVHLGGGSGSGGCGSGGSGISGNGGSADYHASGYQQASLGYNNPRIPPFPHPTVVLPLAQLRQPSTLANNLSSTGSGSGGGGVGGGAGINNIGNRNIYQNAHINQRQRLTSLSDDTTKPLRVCATFAKARSWLLEPPGAARDINVMRIQRKAVDSLFIMAGHGALIQYDLEPKTNLNIPKDKICDDTSIELDVEPKAQWNLLRKDSGGNNGTSVEIQPPLPNESWLLKDRLIEMNNYDESMGGHCSSGPGSTGSIDDRDDRWLSQVEIITHAGPHRRLWMGPQFMFKTYNTLSGQPLSHIDSEAVEVGVSVVTGNRPARSNPMNMPMVGGGNARSAVPVLIESGSCSSYEQSPRLIDQYRYEHMGSDYSIGACDSQLREDLADAMRESPGRQSRDSGSHQLNVCASSSPSSVSSAASNVSSSATSSSLMMTTTTGNVTAAPRTVIVSIAKVVNPLGTVTNVTPEHQYQYHHTHTGVGKALFAIPGTCGGGGSGGGGNSGLTSNISCDDLDEFSYIGDGDEFIHANCDESTFRPVVSVYSTQVDVAAAVAAAAAENCGFVEDQPEEISQTLVVPVIEKKIADKRDSERKQQQHLQETHERLLQWQSKQRQLEQQVKELQQLRQQQQLEKEQKEQQDLLPVKKQDLQQKKESKNPSQKQQEMKKIKNDIVTTESSLKPTAKTRKKSVDTLRQPKNVFNNETIVTATPITTNAEIKIEKKSKKNICDSVSSVVVLNNPVSLPLDEQKEYEYDRCKSQTPTLETNEPPPLPPPNEPFEEVPFNKSKKSKKKDKLQLEEKTLFVEPTKITTTTSNVTITKRRRKPNIVETVAQEETMSVFITEKKSGKSLDIEKQSSPAKEIESFDELDNKQVEIISKHMDDQSLEILSKQVEHKNKNVKCSEKFGDLPTTTALNDQPSSILNKSQSVTPLLPTPSPPPTTTTTTIHVDDNNTIDELFLESENYERANFTSGDNDNNTSITGINVIECFETECSSIQDSIFIDPVVTTKFFVKKKNKAKSNRFADLLNPKLNEQLIEDINIGGETVTVGISEVPSSSSSSHKMGINFDFPEPDMSEFDDAFAPLEPFNLQFDIGGGDNKNDKQLNKRDKKTFSFESPKVNYGSLISFQSPINENATDHDKIIDIDDKRIDEKPSDRRSGKNKTTGCDFDDNNVKVAEIKEAVDDNNDDDNDEDDDDEPPVLLYECQDSDYKSLEQEIDDTYLSIELTASGGGSGVGTIENDNKNDNDESSISIKSTTDLMNSSSTDDSEEISQKQNLRTKINHHSDDDDEDENHGRKKQQHSIVKCTTNKYKQEDDEELQPLICALTVSQEESTNTSSSDNNTNLLGGDDLIGGMGSSSGSSGADEAIGAIGTALTIGEGSGGGGGGDADGVGISEEIDKSTATMINKTSGSGSGYCPISVHRKKNYKKKRR